MAFQKLIFDRMKNLEARLVDSVTRLTYVGNVGIAQEMHALINFSGDVSSLKVTIVGDRARLAHWRRRCIFGGVDNVDFSGLLSPAERLTFMSEADILIAQIGEEFATAIPTKIFEYIACGRKVLLGLPSGPVKDIFLNFLESKYLQ